MKAKTSPNGAAHGGPAPSGAASGTASWSLLADISHQQMAMATEGAAALFRGAKALRQIQHDAAHHATLRHETAARKLHAGCAPAELMAIQSDLLRFDMEEAASYWQQLAGAAMRTQAEVMGSAAPMPDGGVQNPLQSAMDGWQAALKDSFSRFTPSASS